MVTGMVDVVFRVSKLLVHKNTKKEVFASAAAASGRKSAKVSHSEG